MFTLIALFFILPLEALALSWMWKWFIVPVFNEAPLLSVPDAIGIIFVLAFLGGKRDSPQEGGDRRERWMKMFYEVYCILLIWGLGGVVHWLHQNPLT